MKRMLRLSLGVMLGLWLGYTAAGLMPMSLYAAAGGPDAAVEGGAPGDAGQQSAAQLVVAADQVPWLTPVLWGVAGLFVAAVTLGFLAQKLRGPEPPDPADDHHHADDHHVGAPHGHGGHH
jgi:hypothetical protein